MADKKVVEFKFSPGDKVNTPVDMHGIIDLCAINSAGTIQYCVEEASLTRWWNEEQLTLI